VPGDRTPSLGLADRDDAGHLRRAVSRVLASHLEVTA